MILLVGLPAPWPARVSIRIRTGAVPAWAACNVAANLKLWAGKTRSSWSAVVTNVGGYLVPGLMFWSGEKAGMMIYVNHVYHLPGLFISLLTL